MLAPHLRILKVGVSLDHNASLRFVSLITLRTCWEKFQTQNNTRSIPASSALTLVSHRSHNARTPNRHLHGSGENSGTQRRTKVTFGRTMMKALELLRLVKRYILEQSKVEQ